MKFLKQLIAGLLITSQAFAGLPPTSSKGVGDATDITTFQFELPNFGVTHTGTKAVFGILNPSGGGLGADFSASTGIIRDTAGVFSASTINLSTDTGATPLPLVKGGTGVAAASKQAAFNGISVMTAIGDVISQNGTGAVAVPAGTPGQVLQTNGTSAVPSWVNPTVEVASQASPSPTPVSAIVTPNSQTTLTSLGGLIETGNNNVLVNPSFESSTVNAGWTVSNSTASIDTTNYTHGLQSLKLSLSSQTGVVLTQSVTPTAQVGSQNYEYTAFFKTTLAGFTFCPLQAGSEITSQCSQVTPDGNWHSYTSNYVSSATSNGIELKQTLAGSTGTINIDNAYVGLARNTGTVNVDTGWIASTCALTGSSSSTPAANSTTTCFYRRVGDSAQIQYHTAMTGAPTVSGYFVYGPPTGLSFDTTKLANASGTGALGIANTLSASNYYSGAVFYAPSTVSGLAITGGVVSSNYWSPTVPATFASGGTLDLIATVPIVGWSAAANQTISANQMFDSTGMLMIAPSTGCPSGTLLANGATISATQYPHYVAVTGSTSLPNMSALFPRGTGTQTVGGVSYSGPSVGATQTDQLQGHYHNNTITTNNAGSSSTAWQLQVTGSSKNIETNDYGWTVGAAITDGTNGTPRTGTETRPVSLGVNYCVVMNGSIQVPLTIGAVTTSNSTGVERIETAIFSSTGVVSNSSSSWASAATVSTGQFSIPITAGTFSGAPTCTCSPVAVSSGSPSSFGCTFDPTSTSSTVKVETFYPSSLASGATASPTSFSLICMGPR